MKVLWHSYDHSKSFICLKILKIGRYFSIDLEINQLSVVTHLADIELPSWCLDVSSPIVLEFFLDYLNSMLHNHKSQNFIEVTSTTHLLRLSFIWCCFHSSKASSRLAMCRSMLVRDWLCADPCRCFFLIK